jgi:hypothetical protein
MASQIAELLRSNKDGGEAKHKEFQQPTMPWQRFPPPDAFASKQV